MNIKFIDDDKSTASSILEKVIVQEYLEKRKKDEEDTKKLKDKTKGPKMVTVGYMLLMLCAAAPFVGMLMSAILLSTYVKWAAYMKALATQL